MFVCVEHLDTPPIQVNITLTKRAVFRTWYEVTANITVTQNDPTGLPVAGATIEGAWGGGYGGNISGVTNANGGLTYKTDWVGAGTTVTFTVNKVKIANKEYDFTGNKSASIGI